MKSKNFVIIFLTLNSVLSIINTAKSATSCVDTAGGIQDA